MEFSDKVWEQVSAGVDELGKRQLMLDDQGGLTLSDVRRKVLQAKRSCRCLCASTPNILYQ